MLFPDKLIDRLRSSRRIAVLTGAGVSQESGLRTFRDPLDGLWAEYKPEDLATPQAFEQNPQLVWEFYSMRKLKADEVKPNPGHFALAEMERNVPEFSLITQNVDGLHQRSGSQKVIELHGNITRARCVMNCGVFTRWEEGRNDLPVCPRCGANLRPDVVWFGEMLPHEELASAIAASQHCDAFISIGTSGWVQPAASLPVMAKQNGAILVEINTEKTPLTQMVDYYFSGKSGEILPDLVEQLWGRSLEGNNPSN
jgi:NAD-dependent deacetylase